VGFSAEGTDVNQDSLAQDSDDNSLTYLSFSSDKDKPIVLSEPWINPNPPNTLVYM
jgi:hypothetical protein